MSGTGYQGLFTPDEGHPHATWDGPEGYGLAWFVDSFVLGPDDELLITEEPQ